MEEKYFNHVKLKAYQIALEFNKYANKICAKADACSDIKNRFDRASNSIVLNMAEGYGKYSKKINADILIFRLAPRLSALDVWIF